MLQVPAAVLGDDDEVLDPHAELARQVDARLDGDDFAGREHVVGARREARPLVDLEADAVAEPVAEVLAVAGLLDHLAGDRVDVLAVDPGATASSAASCAASTVS